MRPIAGFGRSKSNIGMYGPPHHYVSARHHRLTGLPYPFHLHYAGHGRIALTQRTGLLASVSVTSRPVCLRFPGPPGSGSPLAFGTLDEHLTDVPYPAGENQVK
jgi:hypothetical protein